MLFPCEFEQKKHVVMLFMSIWVTGIFHTLLQHMDISFLETYAELMLSGRFSAPEASDPPKLKRCNHWAKGS